MAVQCPNCQHVGLCARCGMRLPDVLSCTPLTDLGYRARSWPWVANQ